VEVELIEPAYPNTLPKIVAKNVLGKVLPAGKRFEELGLGFINAETVVALANAFTEGHLPVNKLVTVINKELMPVHVRVRIGTHIGDVLNDLGIEAHHGDRLVMGGPMMGHAVHSEDTPILHDTDAVMIQDKSQVVLGSDLHCVNCGECVRVCPANIPINMLIRLLENGLYEDAARDYDLLCCIECGLCSYVCPGRIPVFHYVMLGKYEFARIESMEESNG
jgi:electron transport complex protein RnfC